MVEDWKYVLCTIYLALSNKKTTRDPTIIEKFKHIGSRNTNLFRAWKVVHCFSIFLVGHADFNLF